MESSAGAVEVGGVGVDGDETLDQVTESLQMDETELEPGTATMEQVLGSQAFREELHQLVAQQLTAQQQTLMDLVTLRQRYRREPVANGTTANQNLTLLADI